jgi:hypothetical protein
MTDDEARKLATWIIDTFPTGPKAYIWRDALHDLDAQRAADVYRHMADHVDRLTIGAFKGEYNRRARADQMYHAGVRWTGTEISLDEYLGRLQVRAASGESAAVDELSNWERWLSADRSTP